MPELAAVQLRGRVALVTGGGRGIGRAICGRLGEVGCAVAVAYGSSEQPAREVARTIESAGGRAIALQGDLADPEAPGRLIWVAEEELGPLDILVANAGVGVTRPYEEIGLEDWQHTLDVNLRAPFLLAQRALPGMRERGWGRVLFVSSTAAFTGGVVGAHYAASKAGLHGMLHHLAARVAGDGVTVNAIAPGFVETGMMPFGADELARRIPVGRVGQPDEVADLAVSMLANRYMTSQVVNLSGGMYPR